MTKPSYLILLPLVLLCSCSLFKPAVKSPRGSVSSSRFLEDISITPGNQAEVKTTKEEKLPDLVDDHRVPLNFNTGISISEAIPEQFRYAILLNTEVEYLSNKELYKLIHNWWGTPYKIGGMTQRGVDCSAFVQTIMAGAYEVALPRTAREQKDFCKGIDRSELKEGDLVFFNTRGGVSHVGIYLHNNKFVHASTSGGVTISDLSETYWAGRYLGAGRVAD